jgi:hypothetical protein
MCRLLHLGVVGWYPWRANGDRLGQKALDQADKLASLRAIRLNNNQMFLASKSPPQRNHHDLTASRMKRIVDPYLERRTPGIVTLPRPEPAKAMFATALGLAACQKGFTVTFITAAALVYTAS